MYISNVRIQNYRCFKDTTIDFRPGVNVIIGENNGGKSALLSALGRVFDYGAKRRLAVYDVHQGVDDFSNPPTVRVAVTLRSSGNDTLEDKALVGLWLTKLEAPWKATLTFESFLPDNEHESFKKRFESFKCRNTGITPKRAFIKTLEEFLPKYVARVYGGNVTDRIPADGDSLALFDFQFLDALRDAQSELYSGSNPLLNAMLKRVLDHKESEAAPAVESPGNTLKEDFGASAGALLNNVIDRLDHEALFRLVNDTGAGDGGTLRFDGNMDESDFISALQLFVRRCGFEVPVSHNGLGYNNLLYISLLLSKIDIEADSKRLGQNACIFPMLVIEEPEAHLHPSLQHKLMRYLRGRIAKASKSRQAFITTHSTHITGACDLDELICLTAADENAPTGVAYPGRVFGDSDEGKTSKKYVERFLDATKSNMLFAKGVIFVEGIAEQLIIPQLAEVLNKPFERHHVALIRVDGSTFKHFLPLFGACGSGDRSCFALKRKVACIVDSDPARKQKDTKGAKRKSCWPYLLDGDTNQYDYYPISGVIANLREAAGKSKNIRIVNGTKTFEYDLALLNPDNQLLLTVPLSIPESDSCPAKLKAEFEDLLEPEDVEALGNLDEGDGSAAKFASVLLLGIDRSSGKGEYAFDVAVQIRERLLSLRNTDAAVGISVPEHITEAIEFVCENGTKQASVEVDLDKAGQP
jgi:putative ATP-dependent endonuclease of OLD family